MRLTQSGSAMRRHCVTPRRLGLVLCVAGFLWGVMLMNLSIVNNPEHADPEQLKEEIIQLSEKYVRMLSHDTKNVIDGPYAGRLTGYDLKKTMAVLLENMIDRVNVLEERLNRLGIGTSNESRLMPALPAIGAKEPEPQSQPTVAAAAVNVKDLLLGVQEECSLTVEEISNYPHCKGKMDWMNSFWKSDKCYADNGVDGTMCSFRFYLSEIETWCPPLPNRIPNSHVRSNVTLTKAEWRLDLDGLLKKLHDPGSRHNYEWIRTRISRTWPMWLKAAKNLTAIAGTNETLSQRHEKRILVHLGLLSSKSGFHIPETATRGGPLGELVQWSDIISSLYILGHQLTITSEVEELSAILDTLPNAAAQCQTRSQLPVDMIYTDIVGLVQFKRKVRNGYGKFSCLLRIIDSFGTEPSFNLDVYAKSHHMKTQWGMQNLNPQQFFTMFPHSPDNSFMGFVVEQHADSPASNDSAAFQKKNQAVVYGKAEYMWNGKESYLSIIKNHVDIHATVFIENSQSNIVPSYVHNHGILSGPDLHNLLRESKLFIGLGFPYEGPAPLEAIAQGCAFINPSFNPPHNALNTKFFSGKPTLRKVTSQHPYAEDFIGEPHTFTIDLDNKTNVEQAIQRALKAVNDGQVSPYMPFEYTHEGMLLRLTSYIQHQDFCSPRPEIWPPVSSITVISTPPGKSCKDACWAKKMICEPSHLKRLNSKQILDDHIRTRSTSAANDGCSSVEEKDDIYFPAFEADSRKCFLQKESLLFSCVGEVEGLVRICSCRDFVRGQTALCANCL